ncbi:MAG TPA: SH3 domain-containing protein [Flavisolibacter sp.]|jgi:hypothetical protein|nr:SH3 domain-containing protein [Flavisolibacter sp.]
MKLSAFLLCFFFSSFCFAQTKGYVAAKSGLSLRDKPDSKAAVLGKIPYGSAITTTSVDPAISISTEGLNGMWVKTTHEGKTGYVINAYLLPQAPPKASVKTMKEYLAQLSAAAGTALVVKGGNTANVEEGGTETKKQLYKNGAEFHSVSGYEWNNDTYFLPEFTVEQGFLLVRLIAEFKTVFADGGALPRKARTFKKGDAEYEIKVESEEFGGYQWMKRIVVEYSDGATFTFEMFTLGNQLVISFGGGV